MAFQTTQPNGYAGTSPQMPETGDPSSDTSLSDLLLTLRKRKWILIAAALIGVMAGYYRSVTQPRLYQAYGRIEVRAGSSNQYRVGGSIGGDSLSRIPNEMTILSSDTLMERVARDLDLANNRVFWGSTNPVPHSTMDNPLTRLAVVHTLQANLKLFLLPKTEIIYIAYSSLSPQLSADIVNRTIADYIQRSFETPFESNKRVSEWLSGQLEDLKQQVLTSQEQMMDVQRRLGVLGYDETHSEISSSLENLSTAVGSARLARIMAESRYRTLAGMDPDTISTTIDTTPNTQIGELNALRSTLAAAQTQYATLSVTLLGNNPEMVVLRGRIAELRKQLDTEQARVLSQAKENFKQAQAAENQTTAALLGQKSQADKLGDDLVEYTLRKREFEANSTLYDELRQRLRTSEVEAGLESAEIDVVDHAVPPAGPELQRLSTLILTSLVFSMLAGVVIAFLLESLDSGMRTIAEVEHVTGLPTLAILPREKKSGSPPKPGQSVANRNIDVLNMPKSQYAEAIRSLRTSLLLSTTDHPPKYMLFTSATPAEGKTTTVTNTACVLAQGGSRVLLVDADLRRPNVHHRFGISGRVGLSSVLTGASTLEEAAQSIPDVPGLDVLPSGPIPPFPTEMLGSQSMQKLLEQAGEIYDFILIDSPPVLSVTDSVVLAHRADAVVMIVRQGKVSKHGVRRGRDLLVRSGARMTGIILNAVDLNSPEYRGYYGYSGYSYSSVDNETWESEMSGTGESKKGEDA